MSIAGSEPSVSLGSRSPVAGVRAQTEVMLVMAVAATAAYFFVFPVWRSQFLVEIWFTEGWNAYFQDAAVGSAPLYPPASSLLQNNYPPLSFYAVGVLGLLFGDNLFVGRALSLVALLVTTVEVFACARLLTGAIAGPLIGAFWYLAIMSHNLTPYVGANDPQLAGQAIMGAGLWLFLRRERAGASVLVPLLVMVIGGFWKHNMIAIPLTAVAWLFIRRGAAAIGPVLLSAIAAAFGLAVCIALYGPDFLANLLMKRHYAFAHVIGSIGHLQWSLPALLITLIWVSMARSRAAGFVALHVSVALFACVLQWFGDKVFGNAQFDYLIALGIAMGVVFEGLRTEPPAPAARIKLAQILLVLVLLARLLVTDRHEPFLIAADPAFRAQFSAGEANLQREAREIAAIDGPVYCVVKVACRAAGKPFVVDDFKARQLVITGQVTEAEFDQMLRDRGVTSYVNRLFTPGASLALYLGR